MCSHSHQYLFTFFSHAVGIKKMRIKPFLYRKYFLGFTDGASGINSIGYGAPAEFMISYSYEL